MDQQHELWAPGSATGTVASESATEKLNVSVETEDHVSEGGGRKLRNLNDTLLTEGLIAVKFSCELPTIDQLKDQLSQKFPQNSVETRVRYARYVLRWFFPEGLESLPRRVWMAYREEAARFTEDFAFRKPTFPWLRWNARMFRQLEQACGMQPRQRLGIKGSQAGLLVTCWRSVWRRGQCPSFRPWCPREAASRHRRLSP